jgi:lysozyme
MSEGLRLDGYLDTQDPPHWTIGYGRADTNPKPVRGLIDGKFYQGKPCKGLQITQAEADRLFDEDAEETEHVISAAIDHHLTQAQFDALFDFVHHYGANNFLGSTLLKRINFNPNNLDAIIPQFTRWNINAGKRDKGIYMRSCRRACVYAGAPIPQILWEPRNFPWKVTADDEIDFNHTPDAFFLIELGKDKTKPYVFDPDKIEMPPSDSPEPAGKVEAVGGSPVPEPIEASARPPEPVEAVREASVDPSPPAPAPAVPPPQSNPASVESVESNPAGEGPPSRTPSPTAVPPRIQAPPAPVGQQTSAVDAVRNSKDWSDNCKSLLLSRRFWGLLLVVAGRLWMAKTGSTALLNGVSDPIVTEMFSGLAVMIAGEFVEWWGKAKATRPLK